MMAGLIRLQSLLERIHSFESCSQILAETNRLALGPEGWFFQQLHDVVLSIIDHPDTFYGIGQENPSPVLDVIAHAAFHGIAAIQLGDEAELRIAAKELSSATALE